MDQSWVITSRERVKYTELFKTLNPINGMVTGAQAKGFLLQSQLPPLVLGQIWYDKFWFFYSLSINIVKIKLLLGHSQTPIQMEK